MNSLFNQDQIIYSLDTSSVIDAYHTWYPIGNFPTFWRCMEELIRGGRLKMSQFVYDEAMRDAAIKKWCHENKLKSLFQSRIDRSEQLQVRDILLNFPKLLDTRRGKSGADPWVIALAMRLQNSIVVTHEKPSGRKDRPKIPDVCLEYNIECINIAGMIRNEEWTF